MGNVRTSDTVAPSTLRVNHKTNRKINNGFTGPDGSRWGYTIDRLPDGWCARIRVSKRVSYGEDLGWFLLTFVWREIRGCRNRAEAERRAEQTLWAAQVLQSGKVPRVEWEPERQLSAQEAGELRAEYIRLGIITPAVAQ